MAEYVKSTNFASKDSLASGNPLKIVKGTEFDIEFNNISTAISSKADSSAIAGDLGLKANLISPAFSGTPTAPTAAVNTNNTQIASTAFVVAQIADDAPTKTGGGASGTWAINITGSAASATTAANGGVTSVNGMTGAVSIASAGSPSTAQVLSATAAAGAGDVGTYAMALLASGPGTVTFGQTTAGANLLPSNTNGAGGVSVLSGTWRCMGFATQIAGSEITLWLRVS
jgi:hypothetical protein